MPVAILLTSGVYLLVTEVVNTFAARLEKKDRANLVYFLFFCCAGRRVALHHFILLAPRDGTVHPGEFSTVPYRSR